MLLLPTTDIEIKLAAILRQRGCEADKAQTLAKTFTDNSLDGVYTHGLNRFARFVALIDQGYVKLTEESVCKRSFGAIEQWDGNLAPGILNALQATDRAMALASDSGIGCVGLANTNHWMRGGTYGWRAARQDFIFIGWTNTIANMPAWGAQDAKLGNNPLVLAVPYQDQAIVLDMAQSQFSYGTMEAARQSGERLPVPGGYDMKGQLSREPADILRSQRALPVGYWKGAGLSLLLDILAALISGGSSTSSISSRGLEYGVSQVFIAIALSKLGTDSALRQIIADIISDYQESQPIAPDTEIRYPGQGVLQRRLQNRQQGIPVDPEIWAEIQAL